MFLVMLAMATMKLMVWTQYFGTYAPRSCIFGEWPGGELLRSRDLRIPDLKFFSMLFWLGLMGLASRVGSVALPTSFGGKGPQLKQWLVMLLSALNSFLTGFLGFSSVVRQMPGNLLHCPWCPRPPIPSSTSSFSLHWLTDETGITDLGQMAYQAGKLWLWSKPVGSHCRLYRKTMQLSMATTICFRRSSRSLTGGAENLTFHITSKEEIHGVRYGDLGGPCNQSFSTSQKARNTLVKSTTNISVQWSWAPSWWK